VVLVYILKMGTEGLEPSRPFTVNGFSFSRSFRYCLKFLTQALRIGLSLYPRLDVRVAPVESLHLPKSFKYYSLLFWLGSGLPYLLPDLGFPEFESGHLQDFSSKAQLSKSVASTIPPHPRTYLEFPTVFGWIIIITQISDLYKCFAKFFW